MQTNLNRQILIDCVDFLHDIQLGQPYSAHWINNRRILEVLLS